MNRQGPPRAQCYDIYCSGCGAVRQSVEGGICPDCGARVEVRYHSGGEPLEPDVAQPGMWRYRARLPISPEATVVTMGEGDTPLVRSCAIGPAIGMPELYFKLESCNPTGSFKDRIASLLISRYQAAGVHTVLTITSGNAGSALAAYAARAGMCAVVLQMADVSASRKLQLQAYGAVVVDVEGLRKSPDGLTRAFTQMCAMGKAQGWPVCIMSHFYDPTGVEAYKTISLEICEQLGPTPAEYVYVPVGGGGLFSGMWKGFRELHDAKAIVCLPRMAPVQPRGAASVAAGFCKGKADAERIEPKSKIAGVGGPYASDGNLIIASLRTTGAHCSCPSDDETYDAQLRLAREEGIFAEPAGALSVAGVIRDAKDKRIDPDRRTVCVITGSGFKDKDAADELFTYRRIPAISLDEFDRIPTIVSARGEQRSMEGSAHER